MMRLADRFTLDDDDERYSLLRRHLDEVTSPQRLLCRSRSICHARPVRWPDLLPCLSQRETRR